MCINKHCQVDSVNRFTYKIDNFGSLSFLFSKSREILGIHVQVFKVTIYRLWFNIVNNYKYYNVIAFSEIEGFVINIYIVVFSLKCSTII